MQAEPARAQQLGLQALQGRRRGVGDADVAVACRGGLVADHQSMAPETGIEIDRPAHLIEVAGQELEARR